MRNQVPLSCFLPSWGSDLCVLTTVFLKTESRSESKCNGGFSLLEPAEKIDEMTAPLAKQQLHLSASTSHPQGTAARLRRFKHTPSRSVRNKLGLSQSPNSFRENINDVNDLWSQQEGEAGVSFQESTA